MFVFFFFFFQAEDGIRDLTVTGVQTCALPISGATPVPIPNTAVKPCSADGTPPERARESRPSPASLGKTPDRFTTVRGFFFWGTGNGDQGTGKVQAREGERVQANRDSGTIQGCSP